MTRTLTLGTGLRVFGLFAGYGGLELGAMAALGGGTLVGVAEHEPPTRAHPRPSQAASRVLAHHHPDVPNLGDVTQVDWAPWRGQIDLACGGFPCQDVSSAGLRRGLHRGTRSGLWYEFARMIDETAPALVLIENVVGLRSAPASAHLTDEQLEAYDDAADSDLGPDGDGVVAPLGGDRPVQRALGAVLGDLADLGYDAEWVSVRASDVGAPHRRERVFILGYARDLDRIA